MTCDVTQLWRDQPIKNHQVGPKWIVEYSFLFPLVYKNRKIHQETQKL